MTADKTIKIHNDIDDDMEMPLAYMMTESRNLKAAFAKSLYKIGMSASDSYLDMIVDPLKEAFENVKAMDRDEVIKKVIIPGGIGFVATSLFYLTYRKLSKMYSKYNRMIDVIEGYLSHRAELGDVIWMRHGESEGNVDPLAYSKVGDPLIQLTEKGKEQARLAGKRIADRMWKRFEERHGGFLSKYVIPKIFTDCATSPTVMVYVSPYLRTRQTAREVLDVLQKENVVIESVKEDARIREREFCGSFQPESGVNRNEENTYSRFFWRPANGGESCSDVYDRVCQFYDTLWRDLIRTRLFYTSDHNPVSDHTVLIVSHGLTMRVGLMRWLHWSPERFTRSRNPPNCGEAVLMYDSIKKRMAITEETENMLFGKPEALKKELRSRNTMRYLPTFRQSEANLGYVYGQDASVGNGNHANGNGNGVSDSQNNNEYAAKMNPIQEDSEMHLHQRVTIEEESKSFIKWGDLLA